MSSLSLDTQAALLLCANLGRRDEDVRPLTIRQYGVLAKWLLDNSLRPGDLLHQHGRSHLNEFNSDELAGKSVGRLLERGAALALMTERWASRGIWVVGRADPAYPSRIKSYLQQSTPPVLFGVGEQALLQKSGIAVVGSRHAVEEDLEFARTLGSQCAEQGLAVISGAAKGVDSESMMSSVERGGTSIGILAEGLGRLSIAPQYHDAIADGRLALISSFEPEMRWFAHNAMDRNKLIYGLSDAAVVVSSSAEKGGTWAGALEALGHRRVPVYVKASGHVSDGNKKLLQIGARPFLGGASSDLKELIGTSPAIAPLFEQPVDTVSAEHSTSVQSESSLVSGATAHPLGSDADAPQAAPDATYDIPNALLNLAVDDNAPDETAEFVCNDPSRPGGRDAYPQVEALLLQVLETPCDEKRVAQALNIVPAQAKAWLKRAVERGKVRKLSKPSRYEKIRSSSLF